ncbi:hypothetical protein PSTT_09004 [Puccinia striiformis]|uniref:Peptidase A1 domain-containing protein n=1 Tax=Puccinia striiformis TaxID=27350 RepID=A0A2S4VA61_9BASI|nr:hypothetical protein PSTT_09004 [Puccinia striiformis]
MVSMAAIGAKKSWSGQYTVDCGRIPELPDLTFNFGGKEFTITGEDYILQVQGTCISAFTGLDVSEKIFSFAPPIHITFSADIDFFGRLQMPPNIGELWIIGDVFLCKWYTVYDWGRDAVGFAKAR